MISQYLYQNNEDFSNYVNKYIDKHKIDLDTALNHVMVQLYAQWISDQEEEKYGISITSKQ